MSLFQKIMVPTDFSPHAAAALRLACELAKSNGAALCLVHVYEMMPAGLTMTFYDAAAISQVRDELGRQLAQVERETRQAGVEQVETKLIEGQAHREIARVAEEYGAQLIVMGTHGRTGIAHVLVGSVAERVVRRASCPVITVPLKDAAAAAQAQQ